MTKLIMWLVRILIFFAGISFLQSNYGVPHYQSGLIMLICMCFGYFDGIMKGENRNNDKKY